MNIDRNRIRELIEVIDEYHSFSQTPKNEEESLSVVNEYVEKLEEAEKDGLSEIGQGRDRIVFESNSGDILPKGYVLKISKGAPKQNIEAVNTWNSMGEEARKHVAPIIEWSNDYKWVIQKQAAHTAYGSKEVREKLEEEGWVCTDIRSENVGKINGRYVLMDLGIGLRKV